MEYTDFIAVIDLGTSHIVGMELRIRMTFSPSSPMTQRSQRHVFAEDVYIMVKRQPIR